MFLSPNPLQDFRGQDRVPLMPMSLGEASLWYLTDAHSAINELGIDEELSLLHMELSSVLYKDFTTKSSALKF